MNDERPFERLARHAGPAEVDEVFEDGLYAVIQRDIGRRQPSIGRGVVLVAALLAAGAITGAVAVGSGLVHPPWVDRLAIPTASAAPSNPVEPSPTPMPSQPPGSWTATGSMITPARVLGTATLLADGTVLVAGGSHDGADGSEVLADAELFDPASGSWVATGSMVDGRARQTATLLANGMVLVAGGNSRVGRETALVSAELYDPVAGTWTATGDMAHARTWHTATLLPDGRVLLAGGYDPAGEAGDLASAELYDPITGTWTATGDMTEPYNAHTATLLPNGTVLVAGGAAPSGPGARGWPHAAVYDPVTGTWVATAGMITPRLAHTATLLPDGRVLVTGGGASGGRESALMEAELYDPVAETWVAAMDMSQTRHGHTATLLPDGRVLVVGGAGSDLQAPAELYDPGEATP